MVMRYFLLMIAVMLGGCAMPSNSELDLQFPIDQQLDLGRRPIQCPSCKMYFPRYARIGWESITEHKIKCPKKDAEGNFPSGFIGKRAPKPPR